MDYLTDEDYCKGLKICCVSTRLDGYEELIDYGLHRMNVEEKVRKFIKNNYKGIKNYKVSYDDPQHYLVLMYRNEETDTYELLEHYDICLRYKEDFYSSNGKLTKPARK